MNVAKKILPILAILVAYVFGLLPLVVNMANASNAFANIGALMLLVAGTVATVYLVLVLAGKINEI